MRRKRQWEFERTCSKANFFQCVWGLGLLHVFPQRKARGVGPMFEEDRHKRETNAPTLFALTIPAARSLPSVRLLGPSANRFAGGNHNPRRVLHGSRRRRWAVETGAGRPAVIARFQRLQGDAAHTQLKYERTHSKIQLWIQSLWLA